MALVKGKAKQTTGVDHVSEGMEQYLRLMRDGSLVQLSWLMAKALEGKVFGCNVGLMTSPTTFSPTIDAAMPDLLVTVPSGTTIIPIYIQINFEDTGTVLVSDILAIASTVCDTSPTGTATTIMNMRIDKASGGSQCTATAVVTATGTDPSSGNFIEFWRPYAGMTEDAFNGNVTWTNPRVAGCSWSVANVAIPPIIVGAGSLNVYAAAQAGIGWITAIWIEENSGNLI